MSRVLPLLLLLGCGRDPRLLVDMGPVAVAVSYHAIEGAGPRTTRVTLTAREGCPTFVGEGALDGEPLVVEEEGHTETGSYYFFPVKTCVSPLLSHGNPPDSADGSLLVTLTDDSATWRIGADDAFGMGHAAPTGPVHAGEEARLEWSGPAPTDVFVDARLDDEAVYVPYRTEAEGDVVLELPEDLGAGALAVAIEAHVGREADTCDGPAACGLWVEHYAELSLTVE